MPEKNSPQQPIVQSVWVDCPVAEAFRLFTEGFAEWWPEPCALEPRPGGRIFKRTKDHKEEEWGTITLWEPPARLEFTWHPGRAEDRRGTVQVEFQVEADGTRVTVIHYGWSAPQWNTILNRCFATAAQQLPVAR